MCWQRLFGTVDYNSAANMMRILGKFPGLGDQLLSEYYQSCQCVSIVPIYDTHRDHIQN